MPLPFPNNLLVTRYVTELTRPVLALAWLLCSLPFLAPAQPTEGVTVGSSGKLYSQVLREERSYYVWLPPNARNPLYAKPHYPVLYVLDGETQFLSVAATVERLSALRVLPEAIIVAVRNTDRTRDLTPSHIESGLYMDREAAATSGGGENFTHILRQ